MSDEESWSVVFDSSLVTHHSSLRVRRCGELLPVPHLKVRDASRRFERMENVDVDDARLGMPIGEAMFPQRSIRRLRLKI
jgi:hypothetical protein